MYEPQVNVDGKLLCPECEGEGYLRYCDSDVIGATEYSGVCWFCEGEGWVQPQKVIARLAVAYGQTEAEDAERVWRQWRRDNALPGDTPKKRGWERMYL